MTVVCYVLFILLVGLPLVNSNTFSSTSLSAYYFYVLVTSALAFVTGLKLFTVSRSTLKVSLPLPLLILIALSCYVFFHGMAMSQLGIRHFYYLAGSILCISMFILIRTDTLKIPLLFKLITIIAVLESLICCLQYAGLLNTYNPYFKVTGTWVNPNVTAMFLAMTSPLVFILAKDRQGSFNKLAATSGILLLIALVLLKCRTAWIGSFLSVGAVILFQSSYLSKKRGWFKNASALLLLAIIVLPLAIKLYNSKKASADGRITIWKISAQMISERPLLGYGYGMFEKHYNLCQGEYIRRGEASQKELSNASFVLMAYNEFLENTIEGGVIGLLLFGCTLLSLLIHHRIFGAADKEFLAAYAGVFGFACMSLFNFTIQAVPLLPLLMLYAAILCSHSIYTDSTFLWKFEVNTEAKVYFKISSAGVLVVIAAFLGIHEWRRANADYLNKRALILAKGGQLQAALKILAPLDTPLAMHESYWTNYASLLISVHDYNNALSKLEHAKSLTSAPELYMNSGHCYLRLKKYPEAVKEFSQAVLLQPSKFSYRSALMKSHLSTGNISQAIAVAKDIVSLKPKIPSKQVNVYKQKAIALLAKFQILYPQSLHLNPITQP